MKYFKVCDLFGAGSDYHLSVFFARLISNSQSIATMKRYFDTHPDEFCSIASFHFYCYFSSMGCDFRVSDNLIRCISNTLINVYENVILPDDYSFDDKFRWDLIDNASNFATVVKRFDNPNYLQFRR